MSKKFPDFQNFDEYLYYAYANLQMLHYALKYGKPNYDRMCYMIRAKAFKAYKEGRWQIHDLFEFNITKIKENNHCWYCGKEMEPSKLTIDHVFPRAKGGDNNLDNIIMVCKKCNSSKGKMDLFEWYATIRKEWPPINVLVHYLKNIYLYSTDNGLMDKHAEELDAMDLPFNWRYIPISFPQPEDYWRSADPSYWHSMVAEPPSRDIAEELADLHDAKGANFVRLLKKIASHGEFRPVENEDNIFFTGGEHSDDFQNLLNAARKAVVQGYKVFILPNPKGIRTADYIFERKGVYRMYDLKTIKGKASVSNRLNESIGQTNHILLHMVSNYNTRLLASDIKNYFETNKDAIEVLVFKGNKVISVKRGLVQNTVFNRIFRKLYEK